MEKTKTILKRTKTFLTALLVLIAIRNRFRTCEISNKPLKRPLLIIAHPDDESMFFSPFLYYNNPFILCLSDGDYGNSDGNMRSKEMRSICAHRKCEYKILDYKDNDEWDAHRILEDIVSLCIQLKPCSIVTFDSQGVSGHKNHVSCFLAVRKLKWMVKDSKTIKFYFLKTTGLFEKYLFGTPAIGSSNYSVPFYSFCGILNMLHHRSQMVWFRYLYCLLSSYMSLNSFEIEL